MTGRWHVSAVLLDMDGTLLDTEKVYFNSLVAALNAGGYADDAIALCHAMVGLPGPACEAMLLDRYGTRRLALPGIGLTIAAVALFSFTNGSPTQWIDRKSVV